ncbi:MAG: M48 family metalloprotease, partial [Nitrospirales bacterium]
MAVIKDDETKNAFALPGGKIAVYTGIFPVAENEAGLAAIIGHEVIHALARHGSERISQGVLAQVGLIGASIA